MQHAINTERPPERSLTHAETGFTLIEVMVALAIFAIGSLGVAYMLMSGFDTTAESTDLTSGYEVAQSAIGLIRANGANAIQFNGAAVTGSSVASNATGAVASAISTWAGVVGGLPSGQGDITVSSLQNNGQCPCSATISVYWQQTGQNKNYAVQTIVGY